MIQAIKIVLIVLLYLMIGYRLFMEAEKGLGGREAYLEIIKNQKEGNPYAAYILAIIFTTILWPYFLLAAMIRRKK